mgnify:FL=1
MIRLKDILKEIGDGGSIPFDHKLLKPILSTLEKGIGAGSDWRDGNWTKSEFTVQYLIRGSVNYKVKIACNVKKRLPRPFDGKNKYKGDLQCNVGFDVAGESDEATTNLNEQYRLMATLSNIIVEFLETISDTWFLTEMYIMPKADEDNGDTRTDNKRGKFYQAYIDKQIKRVDGGRYRVYPKKVWKGAKHDEGFVIARIG